MEYNVMTLDQAAMVLGKTYAGVYAMVKPRYLKKIKAFVTDLDSIELFKSDIGGTSKSLTFVVRNDKFEKCLDNILKG